MTIKIERIFGVEFWSSENDTNSKIKVTNTLEICSFYVFFKCLPWHHLENKIKCLQFVSQFLNPHVNSGIFFKHTWVHDPDRIRKYYKFWKYYKYKMPEMIFPEGEKEEFEFVDENGKNYTYAGIIHLSNLFDKNYIFHYDFYGYQSYRQYVPIVLFDKNNLNEITNILTKDLSNSLKLEFDQKKSIELLSKGCVLLHAFGRDEANENGIAIHCPLELSTLFDSVRNNLDYKTVLKDQPSSIAIELGSFTRNLTWKEEMEEIKQKKNNGSVEKFKGRSLRIMRQDK